PAIEMPDIGSVASHVLGTQCKYLPPYIMVPGNHEQAAATRNGFLPASTKVFKTNGRDLSAKDWKVGALEPRPETPEARLAERQRLLAALNNRYATSGSRGISFGGMERFYD